MSPGVMLEPSIGRVGHTLVPGDCRKQRGHTKAQFHLRRLVYFRGVPSVEPHVTATRTYAHTKRTRESRALTREAQSVAARVDVSILQRPLVIGPPRKTCTLRCCERRKPLRSNAYFVQEPRRNPHECCFVWLSCRSPGRDAWHIQLILNEYTNSKVMVIVMFC